MKNAKRRRADQNRELAKRHGRKGLRVNQRRGMDTAVDRLLEDIGKPQDAVSSTSKP